MRIFILLISIFTIFSQTIQAQHHETKPAMVFASGNLKFVFPKLIEDFYIKYPNSRVLVQYDSSGDLTNSILSGVHYDLFFSANEKYPQQIYRANKSITKPKIYTRGSLILLVPTKSNLKEKGIKILKNRDLKAIVIANAARAPYGQASIEALKNMNYYNIVKDKIHYSTDVSTAVDSVIWYDEVGFLSKSALSTLPLAYNKEGVNWINIDQKYYSPLNQAFVVSKDGLKNSSAIKFSNYILSDEGQNIFKFFGYYKID
ncbi:MAG: molybdate ABC transporter substrate-binding protein [Campylobacterota bacterium]|nr:molybdate ABC transporter substrate-binding protein [Campylobacterota bacterium]